MYVALYQYAKSNQLGHAEMLYNTFLTNQYVKQESSKLKLKQTDTNFLAFSAILNGTENEFGSYSNVIENYNFFKSLINTANLRKPQFNRLGSLAIRSDQKFYSNGFRTKGSE